MAEIQRQQPGMEMMACTLDGRTLQPDDEYYGWVHLNKNELQQGKHHAGYCLRAAARANCVHCIVKSLAEGTPIDAKDRGGNTALSWAIWKHNTEAITILRDRGAQEPSGR